MTWRRGALALALMTAFSAVHAQSPAYFVRSLDNPRERREARADILDTPVLPGSVVKAVALVTALEDGVVNAASDHVCRRKVTADGQTFVCAHPDLKRPLSPAEALAYSCNDFFVSLAPRLSRESLNKTRLAAGLPPLANSAPMASSIIGLAGPRTSPRALIDVLARLAGAGKDKPVPMTAATRAVLLDGLRGAAEYGTASALKSSKISALAKTGTILMPSGAALGLVVALTPADRPTHGVVVAAPGGAGVDAAAIAADVLAQRTSAPQPPSTSAPQHPSTSAPQHPSTPALQPIRLGRTLSNGSTRVETIAVDDYIAQVLAGEGQPRAGDAAQQALAITARTFAIANRNRHRREGFDLCDTTHCQVVRAATATTTRAAQSTSGRLLLHQGQPAFVFYSASCGGRTELAGEVWPGAVDYARGAAAHDEVHESEAPWESDVRVQDIERALRTAGFRGDRLRDIRVLARNKSDRVSRVRVEGFTPPEISGHEFRLAVGRVAGFQSIKSTAFAVNRTGSGFHFRGTGFGHGVGLCVVGAGTRAARGATVDDILKFYYPGLTIGRGSPNLTTAAPVAPMAPMAPGSPIAPTPTDIALALPGGEERERGTLMSLIRKSRDDIIKVTGTIPPARLRVTVHPSVESFGRATGQPWWVSGATDGQSIDLLPLTALRQQGQLDRTIRHEVAHALLDGALSKRPMWVREGAAAYFASSPAARPSASRVTCPNDAELLRPISAGAQREAYARAEACFARAMAEGKRWDQIK
jgi:SpoIID/LytB domain protein